MDKRQAISALFTKYLAKETTAQETSDLLAYFNTEDGKRHLSELVNEHFDNIGEVPEVLLERVNAMTDRVALKLQQQISTDSKTKKLWKHSYTIVAIAASVVLALGFLLLHSLNNQKEVTSTYTVIDADPGTNKAILTLANGKKIDLDNASNGEIVDQAGIKISKTADGQLLYTVIDNHSAPVANNTITTPNGGQYQVILPDGTKVWLNAASSLIYPVSFAKQKQRIVELSGEAYFEVAHNANQPFQVKTSEQTVQVLGTKFNINSYNDEGRTITTLAEGSVRVSSLRGTKQSLTLMPGQEAVQQTNNLIVQPADMETALAWKNGLFVFKSEPLENIMRQVSRWYNIEVVFEGQTRTRIFTGGLPRSLKLSALLDVLKDTNINFDLTQTPQGKALTIKP